MTFVCPGCARVVGVDEGDWTFVHSQVTRHMQTCPKMHDTGVADMVIRLISSRITDDLVPVQQREDVKKSD